MSRWQVGDVRITQIVESEYPWKGTVLMREATPEAIRAAIPRQVNPCFVDAHSARLRLSMHAFALELGGRRIIVDTCVGNDKPRDWHVVNQLHTSFLSDLAAAGFPRESVDLVMCTHLHYDHVGWNTMLVAGRWVPTFPNARYLVARKEWEHWIESDDAAIADSVRPVFDAGLVDMVDLDSKIGAELRLEPSPGHTPGHVCVRISSRGEEAVITGDMVHHPIQFARPHWACFADADPELARHTRRAFAQRYADGPAMVLGTHFAAPTAGHIVTRDDAFYFQV